MQNKTFFVSGIGTDVGKSICAAILTEALQADYWKPVQSGDLHYSDTNKVQELISNPQSVFHKETYRLNTPASPHYAAKLDGVKIELSHFETPKTANTLIIEGAGGLFVPLNDEKLLIDLMQHLNFPVILVSRNYLGSINHTLMSIEVLQQRNIPIAGIIFNGKTTPSTENYIKQYTQVPVLGQIPELNSISKEEIRLQALQLKTNPAFANLFL